MIDLAAVAGADVSTLLVRSLGAIELIAIGVIGLLLLEVLYLLALGVYAVAPRLHRPKPRCIAT